MDELLPISVFVEYLNREANWRTLGVFLGAEPYQLNIIEQTAHNHMSRLVELHEYLDKSGDERVTLGRVCTALERLGNLWLAEELRNYKHDGEGAKIQQQYSTDEQQSSLRGALTETTIEREVDVNASNNTEEQSDDVATSDETVSKLKREKEQLLEENKRLKAKLEAVQNCYAPYRNTTLIPTHRLGLDTEMKVKVVTRDDCGEDENVGVSANIRAILSCNKDNCPVVGNNRGTYHVTVVPEQLGHHQLFITINNCHIPGSPFALDIVEQRDYTNIINPVNVITGIAKPRYIAFADDGHMYVTSSSDHCIQVFDSRGTIVKTIGSEGSGDLQFKSPKGIAIYGNTVYVAEWGGHRIQVLTTKGVFVGTIGKHGTLAKQPLRYPADVKISHDGNIYIADTKNDRVRILKPDWTDSHTIDSKLVPDGGFESPEVIAFDAAGNAHITAYYSSTIVVFTPTGQLLRQYDKTHVNSPVGMAIDPSGSSIVASYNNGTLTLFNSMGEYLTTITTNDRLNHPYGVAISPIDSSLWVADADNNRLVQY